MSSLGGGLRSSVHDPLDGIRQAAAVVAAAQKVLLDCIAEADSRKLWRDDLATSMRDWLCLALGCTRPDAEALVRTARALSDLPAVSAELSAGTLSYEHVEAIARFAAPDTDAELADAARGWTVAQARGVARARTVKPDEGLSAYELRRFGWREDPEQGVLRYWGRLPIEDGRQLVGLLGQLVDDANPKIRPPSDAQPPLRGRADTLAPGTVDVRPTVSQAYSDAMSELANTRLAVETRPERPVVVVHAPAEILCRGSTPGKTRKTASGYGWVLSSRAQFPGGPTLSNRTLERISCDCRIHLIAETRKGTPVASWATVRTVPPALERWIRFRDGGCRYPGCGRTRWTAVHHIIPWSRGGKTVPENLLLLCGQHHRLLHEYEWTVRGDPAGPVVFQAPTGREVAYGRTEVRRRE